MERWTTESRTFRTFLLVAQLDPGAIQARIRQARKEADLTQQELADLLERHKRTVENYENVRVPEWGELAKIARVLNRPIEWFLHGDQPQDDELAALADAVGALDRKLDALDLKVDAVDRKLDTLNPTPRLAAIESQLAEINRKLTAAA